MMKRVIVKVVTTSIQKSSWLKIKGTILCLFYQVSYVTCEWFQPHLSWELCVISILFFQYLHYVTALTCITLWLLKYSSLVMGIILNFTMCLVHYCEFCANNNSSILEVKKCWVSVCMNCIILEEPHVYHSDNLDVEIMFLSNHAIL
jgi:hypothetical protein